MSILIEWVLFFVAGTTAIVNANVPGAVAVEITTTRQMMHENAPAFTGAITIQTSAGARVVDCSFFPYWDEQTRYPCSPYAVRVDAREPITFVASGQGDAEAVLVVRVLGYPPRVWLPAVAR